MPATGFGFGDMVIMELLNEKKLVPELSSDCQDIVYASDESLRSVAMSVSRKLRMGGRRADLVLGQKRLKWAFRHSQRLGAERLVMIMPEEWSKGMVRIKKLDSGEEENILFEEL